MAIFLGIDGGGSKTSCLIGDERSVLGAGSGAGSNVVRVGEVRAREALSAAIHEACAAAGVAPEQIARTCIGVAGVARPQITEIVRRVLAEMVSGETEVAADMVIALEAAFGEDPGVIVIAGTGSIAYGANAQGRTARAGGWGFAVSDEGSGHWIGRAAIRALLRAHDQAEPNQAAPNQAARNRAELNHQVEPNHVERDQVKPDLVKPGLEDSLLLRGVMKCWGVGTLEELVLAANASPPPDFAALFRTVLAASHGDDVIAKRLLQRAGAELAGLAGVVMGQLFHGKPSVPVAMSGGVFANSALVREAFDDTLRRESSATAIRPEMVEPVLGALARARRGGAA